LESLVSTTSLESLIKGYLLNCKTENKSPKTIAAYQMVLKIAFAGSRVGHREGGHVRTLNDKIEGATSIDEDTQLNGMIVGDTTVSELVVFELPPYY